MKPRINLTVGDVRDLYDILCGVNDFWDSYTYMDVTASRRRELMELLGDCVADANNIPVKICDKEQ